MNIQQPRRLKNNYHHRRLSWLNILCNIRGLYGTMSQIETNPGKIIKIKCQRSIQLKISGAFSLILSNQVKLKLVVITLCLKKAFVQCGKIKQTRMVKLKIFVSDDGNYKLIFFFSLRVQKMKRWSLDDYFKSESASRVGPLLD